MGQLNIMLEKPNLPITYKLEKVMLHLKYKLVNINRKQTDRQTEHLQSELESFVYNCRLHNRKCKVIFSS